MEITAPLRVGLKGQEEGNPSSGHTFNEYIVFLTLLRKGDGQKCASTLIMVGNKHFGCISRI